MPFCFQNLAGFCGLKEHAPRDKTDLLVDVAVASQTPKRLCWYQVFLYSNPHPQLPTYNCNTRSKFLIFIYKICARFQKVSKDLDYWYLIFNFTQFSLNLRFFFYLKLVSNRVLHWLKCKECLNREKSKHVNNIARPNEFSKLRIYTSSIHHISRIFARLLNRLTVWFCREFGCWRKRSHFLKKCGQNTLESVNIGFSAHQYLINRWY